MPLTRAKKAEIIDDLTDQFESASIIYLTNFSGLTVAETNELRARFREADVEYTVCKNTLAQLAIDRIDNTDVEVLSEHFSGPTAVAFSDDPAKPARVIQDFLEENESERPELKVAYIEGDLYEGPDALDALADLKSREELIGDIIGLMLAPAQNITGGLTAPASTLAGAIQSIADGDDDA